MKSRHPIVGGESSTKNGGESSTKNGGESSLAVKRPVTVVPQHANGNIKSSHSTKA